MRNCTLCISVGDSQTDSTSLFLLPPEPFSPPCNGTPAFLEHCTVPPPRAQYERVVTCIAGPAQCGGEPLEYVAYKMLLVRPGRILLRGVAPAMQHDGGARGDIFRVRNGHEAALFCGSGRNGQVALHRRRCPFLCGGKFRTDPSPSHWHPSLSLNFRSLKPEIRRI